MGKLRSRKISQSSDERSAEQVSQSSDDRSADQISQSSDDQLRELDGIGYATSLSQIRRTLKFVDNGDGEERRARNKRFGTFCSVGPISKSLAAASAKALNTVIWAVCIGIVVGVIIVVL